MQVEGLTEEQLTKTTNKYIIKGLTDRLIHTLRKHTLNKLTKHTVQPTRVWHHYNQTH
jgi:hypothetical protein